MDIEIIPAKPQQVKKQRVAAYARVSSDKDAAFHSLTAQREYYEDYIARHPDWELIGLYSDNGISGTTINRPEFQRMLQDARDGKIDLIITKSITRFARNTVILLETIRELKSLGIDCYFEKEDMHSISADGELLLTLLAMYAEEEARSASENQKWRIKKLYEKGKPAGGHTYGFRWTDGGFVIEQEEARIVQRIFEQYLSGKGYAAIACDLTQENVPSPTGGDWWDSTIRSILNNEKYAGDLLLQKYYREDFKTKRNVMNRGERDQVFVKNSHRGIISKKMFKAVQEEMKKRNNEAPSNVVRTNAKTSNEKPLFAGKIICGGCGCTYSRWGGSATKDSSPFWLCNKYHRHGTLSCDAQRIPEKILVSKTKEVLEQKYPLSDNLTYEIIDEYIEHIYVPEHYHLIYQLRDGASTDVFWEHPSRKESWTDEMREVARERAIRQRRRNKNRGEKNGGERKDV